MGNNGRQCHLIVHNTATDESSAFYGELNFEMGYNLSCNWSLKASYDLALIGGIASAAEQTSFSTLLAGVPPSLNLGGQIFYNGLTLGLEAYW